MKSLAQSDLFLTLATNVTDYDAYEHVVYEAVVQNLGPATATNISVSFPLPNGMVYSTSDATQGSYNLYYETWDIGTLEIGQTVLLSIDLFTLDSDGPKITFAQIQTVDQTDPDSTPGNDTDQTPDEDDEASVTIYPVSQAGIADLRLELLNDQPEVFYDGGPMKVVVHNDGPNQATGISVRINTNANSNILGAVNLSQGTTNITPGTYVLTEGNWVVGTLNPGASATLEIEVFFIDQYHTAYVFAQVQASDQFDPDSTPGSEMSFPYVPNEDDEGLLIKLGGGGPPADLELAMTSNPAIGNVGDQITFNITIQNNGNYPSSNVSIKDILPPELNYISSTASTGVYDPLTGIWYIGFLGETTYPGAPSALVTEATLSIVTAIIDIDDPIANFAQVETGYDIDASPGNDTDNTPDEDDESLVVIYETGFNCSGDITFSTQAEVNDFPPCTNYDGSITIEGDDITDLSVFNSLQHISGDLIIENNDNLITLNGFQNLISIDGDLNIVYNDELSTVTAFSSLYNVGNDFVYFSNPNLESIQTLSAPLSADRLVFSHNPKMTNLDAFVGLVFINNILVNHNDLLENIDGFYNIASTLNSLAIEYNPSLQDLDVFSNMGQIAGSLSLIGLDQIQNFDALSNLEIVTGNVSIGENDALLNLDGLNNLSEVGGNLIVHNNLVLSNCCGIYSLLNEAAIGGFTVISQNPSFCNNVDEILDDCGSLEYCESSSDFPWHDWIGAVSFNTISNPSGKSHYSDFTALSTSAQQGETYDITLKTNYSYYTFDEYFRVWIDFDQNGSFTDPGEMVFDQILEGPPDGISFSYITGTLSIPADALPGNTRMRVSMQRGSAPTPCATLPFGEVEDYSVNILDAGPLAELYIPNYEVIQNSGLNLCYTDIGSNFGFFGGTIVNFGTVTSEPFKIKITFSKDDQISNDDVLWQEFQLSALSPNPNAGSYTVTNPVPMSLEPGVYYAITQLDSDNEVTELYENNNITISKVQLNAADYTISQVDGIPATASPGNTFNINSTITNLLAFPLLELSDDVPVEVFLSEDENLNLYDDLSIGSTTVNYDQFSNAPLFEGGTTNANLSATIPSSISDGDYYLFVFVGRICETDMANSQSDPFPIHIQTGGAIGYCEAAGDFPWHEWIGKVTFAGIDKLSLKSKYSDFTTEMATVENGNNYPITLQSNFSYTAYDEYWRVWIDFNQNGSFYDAGEMVFEEILSGPPDGTPFATISGSILIPDNALEGNTRMRVAMQRGSVPSPCGIIPFGEVEDYMVSIANSFSGGSVIQTRSNEVQVDLFPNPVIQEVYVNLFKHVGQSASIQLHDIYGQTMLDYKIEVIPDFPVRINLSGIDNGLYFLSTRVDNLKMTTKRLVIEKAN